MPMKRSGQALGISGTGHSPSCWITFWLVEHDPVKRHRGSLSNCLSAVLSLPAAALAALLSGIRMIKLRTLL